MADDTYYCPHCDKKVGIDVTRPREHSGHANLPEGGELVCLDFGAGCADIRCPLSSVPSVVMGVRLARSGMKEEEWVTVHAVCEGCAQPSDLKVLDKDYAYCSLCGTTNSWMVLDFGKDGTTVTITGRKDQP